MAFKFEKLEVWQLATDLADEVYSLIDSLPDSEKPSAKLLAMKKYLWKGFQSNVPGERYEID